MEVDFAAAGRLSFFDTYIEQTELPLLGGVKIGHFLQPFSVDAMSGFRNLPFLERSLPFLAFVPFRRLGAMAYDGTEDGQTHWAYSIYRTGGFNNAPLGDDKQAVDIGDVGGWGISGRLTHLLHFEESTCTGPDLWQLGGSYTFAALGANDAAGSGAPGNAGSPKPFYQARVLPEFGPLGYADNGGSFGSAVNVTPFVADTGRYEANNFNLFGIETLWQRGPLGFQAEVLANVVASVAGPVTYVGGYGEFLCRLTGEAREYDRTLGALKNPKPFRDFVSSRRPGLVCGWGAWEIAARFSTVDLRDPGKLDGHYYNSAANAFNATSHSGAGIVTDATLGLTWFLNQHFKVQANWIHAVVDNAAKGRSDLNVFATRVQVDF